MNYSNWQLYQCAYSINVPISSKRLLGNFETKDLAQEINSTEIWCCDSGKCYQTRPHIDPQNNYVKFFLVEASV